MTDCGLRIVSCCGIMGVLQISSLYCQAFVQLNWNRTANGDDKGMSLEIIIVFLLGPRKESQSEQTCSGTLSRQFSEVVSWWSS